jgi:hypothetical protein
MTAEFPPVFAVQKSRLAGGGWRTCWRRLADLLAEAGGPLADCALPDRFCQNRRTGCRNHVLAAQKRSQRVTAAAGYRRFNSALLPLGASYRIASHKKGAASKQKVVKFNIWLFYRRPARSALPRRPLQNMLKVDRQIHAWRG